MDEKTRSMNEETRKLWDEKAAHWDSHVGGDGNMFHKAMIGPATERLLGAKPHDEILDVCSGNGIFARGLAALGANVVATDFSEAFLERAKARSSENIEYRLVDATSDAELLALGEGNFDAAVCNMALMDMVDIEPLARSLAKLLAPVGRFVFSVPHPCFNSNATAMLAESEDDGGKLSTNYSVKLSGYLEVPPGRGAGTPGEPNPHYYFHRPLHELLGACFSAGFVMDAVEEPSLGEEAMDGGSPSWRNLTGMPPVIVARMRLV